MQSKPSILLLYTGGTIGMEKDHATGALKAFDFNKLLIIFSFIFWSSNCAFILNLNTISNIQNIKNDTFECEIGVNDLLDNNYFYSYGLDEISDLFKSGITLPRKILIDVANGSMLKLWTLSKEIKERFGDNIELMVGNIANPETYRKYCEIGVDYIRVGIGGGCFVPESYVNTLDGVKMIKDINIAYVLLMLLRLWWMPNH